MVTRLVSPSALALAVVLALPVGAASGQTADAPEVLPPIPPSGEATGGGIAPLLSEFEQEALLREEAETRAPEPEIVETVPAGPPGEATGGARLEVEPGEQQALLEEREVSVPAPDRVRVPAEVLRGPPGEATGGGIERY